MPLILRTPQRAADRPQRPRVTVFRTCALDPLAVMIHEIAEAAGVRVECVPEKGEVAARQPVDICGRVSHFPQQDSEDKGARVVICAIALVVVGDVVDRVLKDAGVIAHLEEVIELQLRHRIVGIFQLLFLSLRFFLRNR